MNWVGAFAPGTVGGRRAHPPKAEKIWLKKINKKEKRKAIRSAMSAVMNLDIVKQRNVNIPKNYPFILSNDFEKVEKTKELKIILVTLGFKDELKRGTIVKIRSGIGKLRGRKKVKKKSLLFVVADDCTILRAANNIPGIDIVKVNELNTELLAPGTQAGRMTLFTESAIDSITNNKLFTNDIVKKEVEVKKKRISPKVKKKQVAKKSPIKKEVKKIGDEK